MGLINKVDTVCLSPVGYGLLAQVFLLLSKLVLLRLLLSIFAFQQSDLKICNA